MWDPLTCGISASMQSNVKRPVSAHHTLRSKTKEAGVPKWGWGKNTPVMILVGLFWQRSCCLKNRRNYLIFYYKTLLGSGHLTAMLAKLNGFTIEQICTQKNPAKSTSNIIHFRMTIYYSVLPRYSSLFRCK